MRRAQDWVVKGCWVAHHRKQAELKSKNRDHRAKGLGEQERWQVRRVFKVGNCRVPSLIQLKPRSLDYTTN